MYESNCQTVLYTYQLKSWHGDRPSDNCQRRDPLWHPESQGTICSRGCSWWTCPDDGGNPFSIRQIFADECGCEG